MQRKYLEDSQRHFFSRIFLPQQVLNRVRKCPWHCIGLSEFISRIISSITGVYLQKCIMQPSCCFQYIHCISVDICARQYHWTYLSIIYIPLGSTDKVIIVRRNSFVLTTTYHLSSRLSNHFRIKPSFPVLGPKNSFYRTLYDALTNKQY